MCEMKWRIQSSPFIMYSAATQCIFWMTAISVDTLPSMNSRYPIMSWLAAVCSMEAVSNSSH